MDPLRGDVFSPADEDDSGTPWALLALTACLLVAASSAVSSLVTAVTLAQPTPAVEQAEEVQVVYDRPAEDVQVSEVRTDGPIYDLPADVSQVIVCDKLNREYLLLTTDEGGLCLVPYMDEDGEQAVMPQA